MTESSADMAARVFEGKLCRIIEAPWPWNIGEVGYAVWHPDGMPERPEIRWMLARERGGTTGKWAKNIALVVEDATLIKETTVEGAPRTPLEQRAWALKWAKELYPDGTDIDHMGVADWLLKAEETITYPIYHPPVSEGTKAPETLPKRVEFRDSGEHTLVVESNDGADSDDEVATLYLDGGPGYLTALRAKRVIEVLQRAINRA